MTDLQKSQISTLRIQGFGYKKIGQQLGISVNTVKTYCKRHGLGGTAKDSGTRTDEKLCKCCSAPLVQIPGRKPRIFCSDECRIKWWNTHADQIKHRSGRQVVCGLCGRTFSVNQNSNRKYCCHNCYIADRFYGGELQ